MFQNARIINNPVTPFALAVISICVWASLYFNTFFDPDIAWLLLCLERFLAGGTYTGNFYETNPPLSFLIYLPALPLYALNIMNAQAAIVSTFLLYMGISNFCTYKLLRVLDCSTTTISALITALLLTQTWCAAISFGQKDHLVYILLFPSCLFQIMHTYKRPEGLALAIACSIMGALAVCIKPHYAVIPALLFLHRLWHVRSLRITVLSVDFITMFITGLAYLVLIIVLFPDFIPVIVPEVIATYLPVETSFGIQNVTPYFFLFLLSLTAFFLWDDKAVDYSLRKHIFGFSIALGIALFIPLLAQGKWFHYQAIPFISAGFFCLIFAAAFVDKRKTARIMIALPLALLITFSFGYVQTVGGKSTHVLTTKEFINLPYHQALLELASNNKVMFTEVRPLSMGIFYQTPLRSTSRFAQIWPYTSAITRLQTSPPPSPEEKSAIVQKMNAVVDMLADDLARGQPSVVSIPQYTDPATQKPSQNYRDFLMKNQNFAREMKNYTFSHSVPLNKSAVLPAIKEDKDKFQIFDLYVRNQPNHGE